MPHGGTGYFYYRWSYSCPWKHQTDGSSGTDDSFHSAVYTEVPREDHAAQTKWLKQCAMPVVEADTRNYCANLNCNKQGRIYQGFNQLYVKQEKFMYTQNLPLHDFGNKKGQEFGKPI
ncbi:uncharacterized protein N7500_009330 [Penicillium coprophilum]|uniref:uncharacterized protein n=1 Tax=Penicillium coprophilum TaxID=36646 RepID=UPI0023962C35|nr:uncharacterized protein N7500_009330 [Penicillium coprophilum]KAJ5153891.1 hypothetical protein N7500_009330 [Penicillium coprophilum]